MIVFLAIKTINKCVSLISGHTIYNLYSGSVDWRSVMMSGHCIIYCPGTGDRWQKEELSADRCAVIAMDRGLSGPQPQDLSCLEAAQEAAAEVSWAHHSLHHLTTCTFLTRMLLPLLQSSHWWTRKLTSLRAWVSATCSLQQPATLSQFIGEMLTSTVCFISIKLWAL